MTSNPIYYCYSYAYAIIWVTLTIYFIIQMAETILCTHIETAHTYTCRGSQQHLITIIINLFGIVLVKIKEMGENEMK